MRPSDDGASGGDPAAGTPPVPGPGLAADGLAGTPSGTPLGGDDAAPGTPHPGAVRGLACTPAGCRDLASADDVRAAWDDTAVRLWIDLEDPTPHLLSELAAVLQVHPLIAEDILERNQRAKVELTGDLAHLVVFALLYEGELLATEIDLVVGERFVLAAHAAEWRPESGLALRRGVPHYLAEGTDFLLWAILDGVVDGYFPVFDRIEDEIEELQDDVMRRPSGWLVERLFQVRRDLLTVRHIVAPEREILAQLSNRALAFIRPERIVYFRDVYDHLIRLGEELDTHRELVTTTLDVYLSQVNNNLSEVMKRLTAATVILAGVGAVAGVFGMSEAGPALGSGGGLGFWLITACIAVLAGAALLWFRRIGWL